MSVACRSGIRAGLVPTTHYRGTCVNGCSVNNVSMDDVSVYGRSQDSVDAQHVRIFGGYGSPFASAVWNGLSLTRFTLRDSCDGVRNGVNNALAILPARRLAMCPAIATYIRQHDSVRRCAESLVSEWCI